MKFLLLISNKIKKTKIVFIFSIFLACNINSEPYKTVGGNKFFLNRVYSLDELKSNLILYLQLLDDVTSTGDENGAYWVDPSKNTLHRAHNLKGNLRGKEYQWKPEVFSWIGDRLVFGSRVHGFFELKVNGEFNKLSDFGRVGKLSYDGKKIFRYYPCGKNSKDNGFRIENLDGSDSQELLCLGNSLAPETPYFRKSTIYNPKGYETYHIIRKQIGRGTNLKILSAGLYKPGKNPDSPDLIIGLDKSQVQDNLNIGSIRSDGNAILLSSGNDRLRLVDLNNPSHKIYKEKFFINERKRMDEARYLPNHNPWLLPTWSNHSNELALLLRDCSVQYKRKKCALDLILLDKNLDNDRILLRLPPHQFVRKLLWSPNDEWIALVVEMEIKIDHILLINKNSGEIHDMPFVRSHFIQNLIWIDL